MYKSSNPPNAMSWAAYVSRSNGHQDNPYCMTRACGSGFLTPADYEFSEPMTDAMNRAFMAKFDANVEQYVAIVMDASRRNTGRGR